MVKDYFTVKEIAEILDIYEESAIELLNGTIEFKANELLELAEAKGICVKLLMK